MPPLSGLALQDSHRQRIITAARKSFFMHGFRGVAMDDLAAELGISKKTIYKHFPAKIDLLHAVAEQKIASTMAAIEKSLAQPSRGVQEKLARLLACVEQQGQEIQPPWFRDVRREAPELFHRLQHRRAEIIRQSFGEVLLEGQREGAVRKEVSVGVIIEILLGATEGLVNPSKLVDLGLTPQEGFIAVVNVVLNGVLVRRSKGA